MEGQEAAEAALSVDDQLDTTTTETETDEGTADAPDKEADAAKPAEDPDKVKLAKALDRQRKGSQRKSAALHEARRYNAELVKEIEKLKTSQQPARQEPAGTTLKAPKIGDFKEIDEYFEAERAYVEAKAEAKFKAELDARFKDYDTRVQGQQNPDRDAVAKATEQARVQAAFQYKAEKVAEAIPDFAQVMQENINTHIEPNVWEAMNEADNPALVAYFALKEDLIEDLNAMKPARAAIEIARIEAQAQPLLDTSRPTTKTPPPVRTVKGTNGGPKSVENQSPEDVLAWLRS